MTSRFLALALGSLLAFTLLATLFSHGEPIVLAFNNLSNLVVRHDRLSGESDSLRRWRIDEETAERMFRTNRPAVQYDEDSYYVLSPNIRTVSPWEEHPDGTYIRETNSIGIRRDGDVARKKPRYRVALAGDSHMDGVCANSENACALVESQINSTLGDDSTEVINLSTGGYGFFNYLGSLERTQRLELDIDAFAVVVYGGNDFQDTWLWHHFREESTPPMTSSAHLEARDKVLREDPSHYGQYLGMADFVRTSPGELEVMMEMALSVTREIQRLCDEKDIDLLMVYLPAPCEVPAHADLRALPELKAQLELSDEHMSVFATAAEQYLANLLKLGIDHIDLRPAFEEAEGLLYWRKDLHLNLEGHRLVAEAIRPWIKSRVPK